jgi:hypothetical protein
VAGVAVALYVVDINGSHLLRLAGSEELPDRLDTAAGITKTQTGVFAGAVFKLTQAHTRLGLTTLKLLEGSFPGAPTYASCHRHAAGESAHAALSGRTIQLLHSSAQLPRPRPTLSYSAAGPATARSSATPEAESSSALRV